MTDFFHYECPECGYTNIDWEVNLYCALCLSDSGHTVKMKSRPATEDDKAEGYDARKEGQ